jgi:hypothetical protein
MTTTFWHLVEKLLMIDDENPAAMRQWRVLVAMCLLAFFVHILAACGVLKWMGVDGFAQAKELTTITQRLDAAATQTADIQDRLLQKAIVDVRIQQCAATSKRYYTDHLRELTEEYYRLNKRSFAVPDCEALN